MDMLETLINARIMSSSLNKNPSDSIPVDLDKEEMSYGYDAYAYVPSYATSSGRIVSICGNSIADGSYLRSAVCKTVSSSSGSTLSISSLLNSAFPNGMHSTSTVYDELNIRDGKAYKRVGRVNVGSLDAYMFTINGHNWFKTVIPNLKTVDNNNEKVNIIVPNFTVMSANATTVDKKVFNENPGSNVVVFVDDTCNSAVDFKSKMANVFMCYELSEPTVTDISGIIPNELLNITAPIGGFFKFGMDYPEWFTTRYVIEYNISGNVSFTPKLGPVITWIDDDCDPSSIPGVKSLCDRLGIRCTFAHMSGLGSNDVKTTLAEYQEEGFHITTHSHTHTRWYKDDGDDSKFTVKECEIDLIRSMVSMRNSGFLDCDYLIAPGDSAHRDGIPNMVSRHAKAFINSDTGPNFNTAYAPDLFHLRRTFIDRSSHSAAFYQAWIDKVIANKGWLILGTHSYNSSQYSTYFMEQVLTYAKNNGVEILPLNEAVQKFYGNYIAMQIK